ncbi:hypothetical protein BD779DRAFT_1536995 [Infundibulicybe gibba]|nr:hypothetical protein BD779DRAFT_1536995 [Infundibulicybe gibba]
MFHLPQHIIYQITQRSPPYQISAPALVIKASPIQQILPRRFIAPDIGHSLVAGMMRMCRRFEKLPAAFYPITRSSAAPMSSCNAQHEPPSPIFMSQCVQPSAFCETHIAL